MRLAALCFAIFTLGASGALAQGVPALPGLGRPSTDRTVPQAGTGGAALRFQTAGFLSQRRRTVIKAANSG
jgi:hypothetical protein